MPQPELQDAVAEQRSLAGVLQALDIPDTTTSRRLLKDSITHHPVDTSHFTGALHSRGRRLDPRRKPHELLVELPPAAPAPPVTGSG